MGLACRSAVALALGAAIAALTPPPTSAAQEPARARAGKTVLQTFQGSGTATPFDDPFWVMEQFRYATGLRLVGDGRMFDQVGAIHLFALSPERWRELRLPAGSECEVQRVTTERPQVTLAFYLHREAAEVRGGRAQACFISAFFRHLGVDELPPLDRLAGDKDFMRIQGRWFARLAATVPEEQRKVQPGGVISSLDDARKVPEELRIPEAFRGEWHRSLADCGKRIDGAMTVTDQRILYATSEAAPQKMIKFPPRSLAIQALMNDGKRAIWIRSFDLRLSEDGQSVAEGSFIRVRCPSRSE